MDRLEAIKTEGNQLFSDGDVQGAILKYKEGIDAWQTLITEKASPDADLSRLGTILFSNLSNAYLSISRCEESAEAALAGTRADPRALRPHLRYVEARRCAGFPFEAFVYHLRYVRPLVREEQKAKRLTARDAAALVASVEQALCRELGVERLSADVELVEYAGGVDMVSQRHFAANDVIFVERKYNEHFNEQVLSVTRDMTTTKIIAHFAEHLVQDCVNHTDRWVQLTHQFKGAWPRAPGEIDAETRDTVGTFLHEKYPDMADDDFEAFFMVLLMCRYNCFHAGFFRVCALANHSCKANVAMKYNSVDETVTMIAVSDIAPGELMNVKYLNDAQFLVGLGKRREYLRSWLFWCRCERCLADNAEDAVQEYVCCPECSQFTHHAVQPNPDGEHGGVDPLLRTQVSCRACQASLKWADAQLATYRQWLSLELPDTTSSVTGGPSVLILYDWMNTRLARVATELPSHPINWVYRVLFYFFCVGLTSFVSALVAPLGSPHGKVALEDMKHFMQPIGLHEHYLPLLAKAKVAAENDGLDFSRPELRLLCDPLIVPGEVSSAAPDVGGAASTAAAANGCEALRGLLILAHLIAPFYPVYEMWAVHKAICEAVLVHLLFQDQLRVTERLSAEHALTLLERHGPYIGEEAALRLTHVFKLQSTSHAKNVKGLPALNRIRKALKLK